MASVLIERLENITVIHVDGKVSYNEVINIIKHNYDIVTCHILWDLTSANLCDITSTHFRSILEYAKTHRPYCPGGKTAYVSTADSTYGMTRMFSAMAEISGMAYPYSSFRSFDEAVTWLRGVPSNLLPESEGKPYYMG